MGSLAVRNRQECLFPPVSAGGLLVGRANTRYCSSQSDEDSYFCRTLPLMIFGANAMNSQRMRAWIAMMMYGAVAVAISFSVIAVEPNPPSHVQSPTTAQTQLAG